MLFDWAAKPPEINHMLISTGDHAMSLADVGVALTALSALMGADSATMIANTAATFPSFMGVAGAKAVEAAGQYAPLAAGTAGWLSGTAAVVSGLALAHGAAEGGMIPWPVCLSTRTSAETWAAANWHGFFTPIVTSLYTEYGHQWAQNAGAGSGWDGAVFAASGPLSLPGPLAPMMADPAGIATEGGAVGETAGERASSVAMRGSYRGLQSATTASAVGGQQAGGLDSMSQLMSLASTPFSAVSSVPEMFGSLPQTLGQFPQMAFGFLSPLLSGSAAQAANPATALATAEEAARQSAVTGVGAAGSTIPGLSAGAGSGATAPMSSFTQPLSAFNAAAPRAVASAGTAASGGSAGSGGLFGAPGMLGRRKEDRGRSGGTPVAVSVDGERDSDET